MNRYSNLWYTNGCGRPSLWILPLLVIVVSLSQAEVNALTLSTPVGTASHPGNPGTASIPKTAFDGGILGPVSIRAVATANRTDFFPNVSIVNPAGNIMGDDEIAFIEVSHPTQFSDLGTLDLSAAGWNVRLEEPGASFTLLFEPTVNNTVVPGISQTYTFDESTGCEVGMLCNFDDVEHINVNIPGVNEIGIRWTYIADGALTANVVPEPTTGLLLAACFPLLLLTRSRRVTLGAPGANADA